jgi:hypothetical protein
MYIIMIILIAAVAITFIILVNSVMKKSNISFEILSKSIVYYNKDDNSFTLIDPLPGLDAGTYQESELKNAFEVTN